MPEKLKMHTPDLTAQNIQKLAELFPGCVTEIRDAEGKVTQGIDFDQLRQELSGSIVEGPRERYHLDWPGKREAILTANAPIAKTLRPSREESVNFDTTKNLFIEGDNLDALKLLQETYLGKVKLIYIDPPYNTGRDFIYKDSFAEGRQAYSLRTHQEDVSGNRMVANTESNGRFHSDWLSMIYPRLALAKNLLTDDGAIFVSIADHEIHNVRLVLDQVFGGDNFIATVIWHKMDSPKNTAIHFSEDHDYIVIYARNAAAWRPNGLERTEEMIARYKNPDNDPRGPWLLSDLAARNFYAQGRYAITTKKGRVIPGPPAGSYWRVSRDKFDALDRDNRIWWGEDGDNRPGVKRFISEVRKGVVPQTYWHWKDVGSTRNAKQELSGIVSAGSGEDIFITPKPTKLLARILQVATTPEDNDIVLDFFAGSATTGHAVFSANAQDAGERRFILVQYPEPTTSGPYATIADFAKHRLRRSGKSIYDEQALTSPDLDIGFRVLKIDTSNMRDIYYVPDTLEQRDLLGQIDNIRTDRSAEDLLFQVFVDWGLDLALPVAEETIEGKHVFFVDTNALAACFDTGVTDEMVKSIAQRKPLRAVFRDSSYGTDSVKINVEQIFKLLSPETEVRSI
jgi:adenine-specific DNA-methyltransferase